MALRWTRRAALAAGAGCLAGIGLARAAPGAAPLPVREVAPGVFVHQGVHELASADNLGAIANVGFVIGADAVAVIDTGGCAAGGARLRAALRAVTDLPIRYVVASHVHPDHLLGHAAFAPDHPAFVGHAKLPAALAARGAYYLDNLAAELGPRAAGTTLVAPTLLVEERLELDLGGRTLLVSAQPTAHTDNDLAVLDDATGTLWLADLLFMERVPVIDGSLLGWLEVLAVLRAQDAVRVVPGHGPASAAWPEALLPLERYLTRLRDEIRALIASGGTLEQAVATVARDERPRWRLFDVYHPRNVTAAFTELEWE
ncbi:MAG TPA: quinoprotein relay system zinc metallohydrolase 2 [Geminicoccaceae bacterium]|nr:quinoprotein relay system zinc metallohydrolase 2 [Geminicoccaceae bacterium]